MKHTLLFITIIFWSITIAPTFAQDRCNSILNKVVTEYDKSNGISAKFVINSITNGYETSISGNILLKGKMFAFTTDVMECGYDGETLWSYIKSNEEINLSNPDEEEIINMNPYLLFKNYNKRFNCSYEGKKGTSETLLLTPKNSNDNIKSVKASVNSTMLFPSRIEIINKDKSQIIITISDYNSQINIKGDEFVFDARKYKDIEIIDLR
ncbi:MAG: outer-membrane lipoprotein carrier protein LolA [Bacteroidales bacterium]|nr:outer-membrane lipoprotein carrier protein LolA [Bacteroidales bacterium]